MEYGVHITRLLRHPPWSTACPETIGKPAPSTKLLTAPRLSLAHLVNNWTEIPRF